MQININDTVAVVLTESGAKIWNDNEMKYAKYNIPDWEPRLKQQGDVLRGQLWSFMRIFGRHMHLGGEVPFDKCLMTILEDHI